MNQLTEAIRAEIEARRARHPGRPDRELLEHLLVALHRERVVAVGFDTVRLGDRLARTRLPEAARSVIARAVGQVWLDENMHARYLLGLLRRQGDLGLHLEALGQSLEGGMAGWVVSVEQLERWSDAPGDRSLAAMLELAGRLGGKIPDEIRPSLTHQHLRDYCRFNADAERSAAISFAHMRLLHAEVLAMGEAPALVLPDGFAVEVTRMEEDERLHQRVFEAIAGLLGEDDELVPGKGPDDLVAAVAAIDGWLVPAALLGDRPGSDGPAAGNPVGGGGVVAVSRGEGPADKLAAFDRALAEAEFFEQIERRAAASGKPRAAVTIAVKPDLMMAYHRDDRSTFTEPMLVERLVDALFERGFRDLRLVESQNLYGIYYQNRGVEAVARYVGYRPERYRVVDLSQELEPHTFKRGMGVYSIGRSWRDADVRISFAKLKTHVNAVGALTIRNVVTVIPQFGEHLFSGMLADLETVCMGLLHDFPPHFGVIDGYDDAADGLMGFMADPTPKHPRLFVAGADVMCVDYVGLWLMGERDPMRALDLAAAVDWFGDPRARGYTRGDLTPIADWDRANDGLLAAPLAALAGPVYAALSGKGSLFTPEMDADAFPPVDEGRGLAAVRGALRTVLGFHRKAVE
jgi:uncharacterized protein (DUF362 family)